MIRSIEQADFAGKTVVVRVDFNVPLDKAQQITDDRRMRAALPTLNYILDKGGALVLMSHLGRPKDAPEDKYSLRHLQNHLSELLGRPVFFVNDCVSEAAFNVTSHLMPGDVVLLENVRFYPGETKGDRGLAEQMARHGHVFVNDAFGSAHRAHSSVSVIADFFQEKYAGYLLLAEVENAQRVLESAARPYVAIMGGAKVSDKMLVIEQLLQRVDTLIIGGGMAYTFLKAQGKNVGKSLVEDDRLDVAREVMAKAQARGCQLILPSDSVIADAFDAAANAQTVSNDAIPDGWMGLDIGPASVTAFKNALAGAKTILWNGPMGVFEFERFAVGTNAIAQACAEASDAGAYTLVGGGDSAAAIEASGLEKRISYVSTGGGALLEYLEGKTLPGVAALDY